MQKNNVAKKKSIFLILSNTFSLFVICMKILVYRNDISTFHPGYGFKNVGIHMLYTIGTIHLPLVLEIIEND